WAAVAVRPATTGSVSLSLYQQAGSGLLARDTSTGVNFVMQDRSQRSGTTYPRVSPGSVMPSRYYIHKHEGVQSFLHQLRSYFGAADVIRVFDRYTPGGDRVYVRVVPDAGLDVSLYAFASDPSSGATHVRLPSSANASSTQAGAGGAEGLVFERVTNETLGIVVTNEAGTGGFDLYADGSAPTGSVLIDDGAATTVDATVRVTLTGTDAQSGIGEMRVSGDGLMDSEPWIPYTPSADITLRDGLGSRAVIAQYRNKVGLTSPLVSDWIERVAPTAKVSVLNASVVEGDPSPLSSTTPVAVMLILSEAVPRAEVSVVVSTSSEAATAGRGDYTQKTATVTFAPGSNKASFTVNVTKDTVAEHDEVFSVKIGSVTNAVIGDGTGVVTILDDD
ncbi:MAG TPA: Calx-beta domain-containing protein, partial [Nevskiaceae bacterium]|nr:Calx-beta domain-containing protein [Nevskiaceae bacterium]